MSPSATTRYCHRGACDVRLVAPVGGVSCRPSLPPRDALPPPGALRGVHPPAGRVCEVGAGVLQSRTSTETQRRPRGSACSAPNPARGPPPRPP
eukprot:2693508-Pleurochrysis_carterae.AAC.1